MFGAIAKIGGSIFKGATQLGKSGGKTLGAVGKTLTGSGGKTAGAAAGAAKKTSTGMKVFNALGTAASAYGIYTAGKSIFGGSPSSTPGPGSVQPDASYDPQAGMPTTPLFTNPGMYTDPLSGRLYDPYTTYSEASPSSNPWSSNSWSSSTSNTQSSKPQGSDTDKVLQFITNGMLSSNQLTDKQVDEGDAYRTKARQEILKEIDYSKAYISDIHGRKIGITTQDTLPYTGMLYAEIAWWNANPELSPRQVRSRWIVYSENLNSVKTALQILVFEKTVDKAISAETPEERETFLQQIKDPKQRELVRKRLEIYDTNDTIEKEKDLEEKRNFILNKTAWVDMRMAFQTSLQIALSIIYILFALRMGGFSASQTLYKPVPYRVLAFAYTLLFAPVFGLYYLWRTIAHYILGNPLPPYFSVLPLVPYDPSEKRNLDKSLYGYAETAANLAWISQMQQAQKKERLAALQPHVYSLSTGTPENKS